MAGALISTVSDMLKYRYLGKVQSQLNNEILVEQILQLDSKRVDLDGLKAVVPLHYGRNTGVGPRREDEDLPTAGAQRYKTATYDLAYMYGRARFTGPAMQKTKTDAGAFIRVVTDELDRLRDDLALDTARQYYGDGTGTIAEIASVAGAVLTLTSDEALQKGFLHLNMLIDIGDSSVLPSNKSAAVTIDDINILTPTTSTITVSAAGTAATGDFIFRSGANDASGHKGIDAGLQALVSTTANTIGGLNAAGAGLKWWDNQRDNVAGAISLDDLMENWNHVTAAGGAKPSEVVCLTTPGIARRLFASADFKSNVRFVDRTELKGGFESISFSSGGPAVRLVTDRHAPYGKVFFVPTKHIKVYSPGNWDFLSRDGLTIRWVDGKDAFQAVLFRYVNMGTNRRSNSLVMYGVTDTGF